MLLWKSVAWAIVNPHHGDLSDSGAPLSDLLKEKYLDLPGISAGILLKHDTSTAEALRCRQNHADHSPVLIHAGFGEAKILAEKIGKKSQRSVACFSRKVLRKALSKTLQWREQNSAERRFRAQTQSRLRTA